MTAVHVHRPASTYRARWRRRGARKWDLGGVEHDSMEKAAASCLSMMLMDRVIRYGEVILCAECYDPAVVLEIRRK